MADPGNVAAIQEELTIQQVILDSLETESFEGIEVEREEAKKEIERLKALIARANRRASQSLTPSRGRGKSYSSYYYFFLFLKNSFCSFRFCSTSLLSGYASALLGVSDAYSSPSPHLRGPPKLRLVFQTAYFILLGTWWMDG
jgi:hypothetical protein